MLALLFHRFFFLLLQDVKVLAVPSMPEAVVVASISSDCRLNVWHVSWAQPLAWQLVASHIIDISDPHAMDTVPVGSGHVFCIAVAGSGLQLFTLDLAVS